MQAFVIGSTELQAAILTRGATLHRLRVAMDGRSREVVLSLRTPEQRHESQDYLGVSIAEDHVSGDHRRADPGATYHWESEAKFTVS